jgi:outer membrane immunogenic protein
VTEFNWGDSSVHKTLLATATLLALGGSAFAADLPNLKRPPVYAPAEFTWTGLYVGGQVGYQWGVTNFEPGAYSMSDETYIGGLPQYDPSGVVGGVHVGFNWQSSQ